MAYPDFGGGAAYGDAYDQGAGFYAAGAENESPNKGGKGAKNQPVLAVTIRQINELMREAGGEGSFTLDVSLLAILLLPLPLQPASRNALGARCQPHHIGWPSGTWFTLLRLFDLIFASRRAKRTRQPTLNSSSTTVLAKLNASR